MIYDCSVQGANIMFIIELFLCWFCRVYFMISTHSNTCLNLYITIPSHVNGFLHSSGRDVYVWIRTTLCSVHNFCLNHLSLDLTVATL